MRLEQLLTNKKRCRRGLSSFPIRVICRAATESLIHLLRDCSSTRLIWHRFLRVRRNASFFNLPLHEWLIANLTNKVDVIVDGMQWNTLYGIICWLIWKQQNRLVFAMNFSAGKICVKSIIWAKHESNADLRNG